tara:strand:+ start:882 stop:1160 length:279 start_codon:yes stop_codon:yes gene_type:complete
MLRLTTGLPMTLSGKSQLWDTPTSWSSKPRAYTISVALGSNEHIRIVCVLPDIGASIGGMTEPIKDGKLLAINWQPEGSIISKSEHTVLVYR